MGFLHHSGAAVNQQQYVHRYIELVDGLERVEQMASGIGQGKDEQDDDHQCENDSR